jgi:NADH-quinone oxidoreductase subunit M
VISATVGVILSAAYMLAMIQRIFYGPQSAMVADQPVPRLTAREHILLWQMAVLMLAMGVLSPFWIRAIDQGVSPFGDDSKRPALVDRVSSQPPPAYTVPGETR